MDLTAELPGLVLFAALLLANAFFVASEYALVRVRETQLDELAGAGSTRARLAARMVRNLESYISAAQLGVTLCSLLLGFVGEPAVARVIEPAFTWLVGFSEGLFRVVAFVITFGIITFATLVLGELAPKYVAIQRALSLALWSAYPLDLFHRLTYPFTRLVNGSASRVVRLFGVTRTHEMDAHSPEELRMLVAASTREGILQESEREIVGNALGFAETLVRQIMVPRTEMIAVPDDMDRDGILVVARQHPYSRIPVFHGDLDDILGVVHLRDLALRPDAGPLARDLMRRVPMLPETTHLDHALAELRRQRASLAIVIDEFGGTAGLLTVEDIVEEIVGEVQDEFDREPQRIRQEGPDRYLLDGLLSVDELREHLDLALDDEPNDTLGGLVFSRLGRLAVVGDAVPVEGWRFEVVGIDGRRVAQVRAERVRPAAVADRG